MARSGDTDETQTQTQIWGTWEDLLLASAVNRHGTSNWDSVAIEVQSRSPFSHLLTSTTCRLRFLHLRRRFNGHSDDAADLDTSDSGAWVEELRKIRVAELRREVEQYDLSIVSLELKVNRLKEEREHSLKESDPSGDEDAKQDPTVEDRKDDDRSPGSTAAEISSRSCKESNSTDLKQEDEQHKPKPEDDSGTGTGTHTGTGDESRESSDVQSSASLSTRRRKDDASSSEVEMETEAKSEPFMAFLEMIRCDKSSGSVFERRLDSQESERYKSMIKRHVDLETIRAKLELRNSNSIESPLEFYRDLLLLCTNALVFFPKSSPEYSAASNLQSLVNKQLASTNLLKPRVSSSSTSSHKEAKLVDLPLHKPDPDSSKLNPLLEKPAIIMCRKRSSLSKPSSQTGSSSGAVKEEKQPNTGLISEPDPNPKKTSSTRGPRTSKTRTNTTLLNPNPKAEKQQQVAAVDKDKKRNAVDFLNRLKSSSSREKGEGKRGRKSLTPPGKRNVGRPPKRPAGSSSVTPPHSKRFKEDKRRSGGRR